MVFLLYSRYVMLGFVQNMNIFCSEDLFWFQSYWSRDILHGNFKLLFGNSMVVIQTHLTLLCHKCWRVCLPTVTYDWFPVILGKLWRVPNVGQEMLTLSGTPDLTPFREFIISPIRYICDIFGVNHIWLQSDAAFVYRRLD